MTLAFVVVGVLWLSGLCDMYPSELETQLREEAAQDVPPFGAESIKIARRLGTDASSLLLQHVAAKGETAFLSLEALREADPTAYHSLPVQQRVSIYMKILRSNIFYNAWGLPGYQLTETSHALISLGDAAISALKPLLTDQRLAPVSGSEDATTSTMYGNRVCDYAWVFISEILGRPYNYSTDTRERDVQIVDLRRTLDLLERGTK